MDTKKENSRNRIFEGTGKIVYGERFIGRKSAIRQLRNRVVEGHGNIAVIGMPRVGKTSLVWEALMQDKQNLILNYNLIPVFIESASVTCEFDYLRTLLDETCQEIESIIDDADISLKLKNIYDTELSSIVVQLSEERSPVENANLLKKFFRKLFIKASFGVIFILDEFDHVQDIFKMPTFQILRELSINPKAKVSFVTTSRKSIEEIESKDGAISNFHGTFIHLFLGLFDEDDMSAYWDRIMPIVPIPVEIKNSIAKIVGSHPYFLDLCCIQYLWEENIDDLYSPSFKMKIYAEFNQIIEILRRDNLLNPAIQLIIGPPLDVSTEQLDRLVNFGIIKLVSITEKNELLHISHDSDSKETSYVLFGDFFTVLFYSKFLHDVPYWPLWGKTENKLRDVISFFVSNRYGDNWVENLEAENQEDSTWMGNWSKIKARYLENKDLAINNRVSSPIDFTETGHIYYQFIRKYWKLWFNTVFTETQEDIDEASRTQKKVDPFYGWARRFEKLIQLRRPFAHNNTGILTQEEINVGKQYCEIILHYIDKWNLGSKILPSKYDSIIRNIPNEEIKRGIYDSYKHRVVVSSSEWKYFYAVRSTKQKLYDGAEVEFKVGADEGNPKFKIALEVRII